MIFINYRGTQQDIFNAMGSMYAAVLFIGITNATAVQPVVSIERVVSYRERAAGMYAPLSFAFAQVWAISYSKNCLLIFIWANCQFILVDRFLLSFLTFLYSHLSMVPYFIAWPHLNGQCRSFCGIHSLRISLCCTSHFLAWWQ